MGLIWHEGPWRVGSTTAPCKAAELGDSALQAGLRLGLQAQWACWEMLAPFSGLCQPGENCSFFFLLGQMDGVGGEGQASSGLVGAFSSGAPILFEPRCLLCLPEKSTPVAHQVCTKQAGCLRRDGGAGQVKAPCRITAFPNSKSTLCPALQVTCQLHAVSSFTWGKEKSQLGEG